MQMRNLILVFLCTFFSQSSVFAVRSLSVSSESNVAAAYAFDRAFQSLAGLITFLYGEIVEKHPKIAVSVLAVFALSLVQKESPDFFNTGVRLVESPFLLAQKKLQQIFCGGQSLTWNEVASWHNRVSRLLTPLTKTTSMVDLSKDRRLRIMDQEDSQDDGQDDQWKRQVNHIERECGFIIKMLTIRLAFYKDQPQLKNKKKKKNGLISGLKKPVSIVQALGKSALRTSLTRNEEVAFGLEEAISYLQETIGYCKSVSHFSGLDKEYVKRLMSGICTTFEHIGVLVDELSAADKNKKKLPMTVDGALTRGGYAGGYDSSGGSYG
jgi:hypothetical protein